MFRTGQLRAIYAASGLHSQRKKRGINKAMTLLPRLTDPTVPPHPADAQGSIERIVLIYETHSAGSSMLELFATWVIVLKKGMCFLDCRV